RRSVRARTQTSPLAWPTTRRCTTSPAANDVEVTRSAAVAWASDLASSRPIATAIGSDRPSPAEPEPKPEPPEPPERPGPPPASRRGVPRPNGPDPPDGTPPSPADAPVERLPTLKRDADGTRGSGPVPKVDRAAGASGTVHRS